MTRSAWTDSRSHGRDGRLCAWRIDGAAATGDGHERGGFDGDLSLYPVGHIDAQEGAFCGASCVDVAAGDGNGGGRATTIVLLPNGHDSGVDVWVLSFDTDEVADSAQSRKDPGSLKARFNRVCALESTAGPKGMCLCARLVSSSPAAAVDTVESAPLYTVLGFESGRLELWSIRLEGNGEGAAAQAVASLCDAVEHVFDGGAEGEGEGSVMCVGLSWPRRTVVCGGSGCDVKAWRVEEDDRGGMCLGRESSVTMKKPGCSAICVRPDHKVFAVGCWDYSARLFGVKKLTPVAALNEHRDAVNALAYAAAPALLSAAFPAPFMLAAGSKDGRISVWNFQ